MLKFYEKFPELKDQKLHITGSHYAGSLIPRLALSIIEHNRDSTTPAWVKINMAGLLLVNPCTVGD